MAYRTVLGTYYNLRKNEDMYTIVKFNKSLIKVILYEYQKTPIRHYISITIEYAPDYSTYLKIYKLVYRI